jgi:hypothetical protein
MKNIFGFIVLAMVSSTVANAQVPAQKIWETKTAQVRFIAEDDKDIDALNKEAVSRLEPNGKLSFTMLMKEFHFDMGKMEEHFNEEYVESNKFPRAIFNGQISNIKTVDFKKNGKYPVTITGTMQVHGVNKAIQANGIVEVKNSVISANSKFTVTLKDFGIGGLLIKMVANKIDVEVNATYQ